MLKNIQLAVVAALIMAGSWSAQAQEHGAASKASPSAERVDSAAKDLHRKYFKDPRIYSLSDPHLRQARAGRFQGR